MAHLTVEVVYRGIFQKNLAARITRGSCSPPGRPGGGASRSDGTATAPSETGPGQGLRDRGRHQEELEQHMARYEPKELHVTICVDDTLCKGVESWAWYGLQPINRLLSPAGICS